MSINLEIQLYIIIIRPEIASRAESWSLRKSDSRTLNYSEKNIFRPVKDTWIIR